ncbi:MAG: hypothetical protein ABI927_07650 [Gaiellaceae bacterium]
MARSEAGKAPPISVAVSRQQRDDFEAEARRRGVGVSTAIRSLAVERAAELRDERQRERARRWQTDRMRVIADRIEAGGFVEASQAEIDSIFDQAEARDHARPGRRTRA